MNKLRKLILNALLLTVASFLIRAVSVGFNIFLSGKIGSAGMGLFSLIASVYSLAATFATSGISIAATRLTSTALGKNDPAEVKAAMKKCFVYSACFGTASAVLLFILSEPVGKYILSDTRTVIPLRLLAITLPLISVSSAMNGYFISVRRVYKNAATQVFEQAIKIFLTVYALNIFIPNSLEAACITVIASGAVAEIASFIFIFTQYVLDKRAHLASSKKVTDGRKINRDLLSIALPSAFSSYARSGLSTLEHILIPRTLELSGESKDRALSVYGMLHGMVLPIVLFPSAIISSFSGLLVPELAECQVKNNRKEIRYIISRTYQLALLFAVGVAGILICFSGELGIAIYNSTEAGRYIKLIAPLVPIMYIDTATDSMLKGLGEQIYTMNVNLVDSALGVILVLILIPRQGIDGYIAVIYVCESINAILSVSRLLNTTGILPNPIKLVFGPLFCICGATSCIKIASYFFHFLHIYDLPRLIFCVLLSSLLYLLFARITGCLSKDDIRWAYSIIKK